MPSLTRLQFQNVTIVDVENEERTLRKIYEGEARRSIVKGITYPISHLGAAVITIHVSNKSLIKSQATVATAKVMMNSTSLDLKKSYISNILARQFLDY